MAITNEYADGLYKRSWDNNNWVNFNDTNDCYRRNWDNSGWDKGSAENGIVFRRRWDDAAWVQIYPKGVITVPSPPPITSGEVNMSTKQRNHSGWNSGGSNFARQGWCVQSGAGGEQFGFIKFTEKNITGAGSIIDPGSVKFSGKLGASGNYNTYQVISFRGTSLANASGNPFGTHDPNPPFTFEWKATGANTMIPEGDVGGDRNTLLRWMNNHYYNLCVYNGETSGWGGYPNWSRNYLSIKAFNLKVNGYSYTARNVVYDRPRNAPRMFGFSSFMAVPKDTNYLSLVLPEHLTHIDAEEAIDMLENEKLDYLKEDSLIPLSESGITPKIMSIDNNVARVSHIPNDDIYVQYEGDDNLWRDCICINPLHYKIPEGAKRIRLYDKSTDEVFVETII